MIMKSLSNWYKVFLQKLRQKKIINCKLQFIAYKMAKGNCNIISPNIYRSEGEKQMIWKLKVYNFQFWEETITF